MDREQYLGQLKSDMELAPNDEGLRSITEAFLVISLMTDDEWEESGIAQLKQSISFAPEMVEHCRITAIGDFATDPIDGISFQCLAEPSLRIPLPPRFIFGSCPEQILADFFSLWGIPSMGVFSCRNVTLIGEFLLSRGDQFFRSSELNIHPAHIEQSLRKYSTLASRLTPRRVSGRQVCLAGPGYGVYGHWLAEYLPKLGVLHFAGYDLRTLSYLMPTSVPQWATDWLRLLGIRDSQFTLYDPERESISAEELLLPTVLHNGNRVSPLFRNAAVFLKDLVSSYNGPRTSELVNERIFVSRKRASQARSLVNRDRIESMAVDAGFTLVYPEQLAIQDQVALFSGARQIIGEYGSGLHGTMFSGPGAIVCALRGNALHPGFIQSGLGEVMEQPTGYVMGETDGGDQNGRFTVSERAFETCLRLIFSDLQL